ncbi:hypothetical protein HPP92_014474 [Vanilla planifolia]|uniref:Uncharacterized protein n=1 Tax=Vanilla planifolia TaxID=51239 RepID=A0A835UUU2_VANPL|nr:hypothetical protein HPP92_014474 [Vanilla planifolia]
MTDSSMPWFITCKQWEEGRVLLLMVAKCRFGLSGVPWTEEEHRTFLAGLEKLGKGDWRGISRNFVLTRTPTQVASHAQKYFLRQNYTNKKKRRSSLFDVVFNNKTINTSVKSSDESLRTTVLSNNHLTESTSCSLVQTTTSAEASCSDIPNLLKTSSVNPTTSILSLNPIVVADQTAASFLKLSLPLCPTQPLVDSSTTVDGDLELSIAPPQSHGSLASMSAGSIRVV